MAKRNPPRPAGAPPRPRPGRAGGGRERPRARPPLGGEAWSPSEGGPKNKPGLLQGGEAPIPRATSADAEENLPMVPLVEADAARDQAAPGAHTEFFVRKNLRGPAPSDTPEPAPTAPARAPSGPPPGMAHHGMGAPMGPPQGAPMAMGAPMAAPPMGASYGIQGPVAAGPVASGPVAYGPGASMPPDGTERSQSYRVFAVIAVLVSMVFAALLVTVSLLVWGLYMASENQPEASQPVAVAPPPPARRQPVVDTAAAPERPRPKKEPKRTVRSQPKSSNPTPSTPKSTTPAPPPKPAAPVGPAPITIKIPPDQPFTSIQIDCPLAGFRERASISGGLATLPAVPQEDCKVSFKGGPPAFNTIRGGQTKTCTFPNGQAKCE